ncbi:MAG: hypothetical protein EA359_00735 [Balneolaceae bacterium]|nr:MAG: hypothetical protein EA359_00735 [Balneolaceae bacterium]
MINRSALLLKYKEPAIQWITETDPNNDDRGVTLEMANNDRTVFLISEVDAETDDALQAWVNRNYKELFEAELEEWYTDATLWPKPLTLKLFREWFDVECHSVLIDTVGGEIIDDGL